MCKILNKQRVFVTKYLGKGIQLLHNNEAVLTSTHNLNLNKNNIYPSLSTLILLYISGVEGV